LLLGISSFAESGLRYFDFCLGLDERDAVTAVSTLVYTNRFRLCDSPGLSDTGGEP
jgi:hypothetical protein